jgi:hypothetical protein
MPDGPTLVVAATAPVWDRLRRGSGARALLLAEDAGVDAGDIRWLPLDPPESDADATWAERLKCVAATPAAPIVLLWHAPGPGGAEDFARSCEELGHRMSSLLQRDRMPPPVAAVVYVAERGLGETDALVLEAFADARRHRVAPPGLAELIGPQGRSVYVMSGSLRVDREGRPWPVQDAWPVEVARLLALIEASPDRPRGIRAWRSIAFNPTRFDFQAVEVEAFRIAREIIGSPDGTTVVQEGQGLQLERERVPETQVSVDSSPRHCDDSERNPSAWPELGSWWELPHRDSVRSVDRRTDTSGSRRGRRSDWYDRFDERGRRFINDRERMSLRSLEETMGATSVQLRLWQQVHADPDVLAWVASGQFYVAPEADPSEITEGMRAWQRLGTLDRAAHEARSRALIEARELDTARSHFLGLGWRAMAAAAGAVFIAAVFGSMFRDAGPRWILGAAAAGFTGSIVAAGIMVWLEIRAGARGRFAVESTARSAESAIAEGFLKRMQHGAAGELSGRQRHWLQCAAKVRESAVRLLALRREAESAALQLAATRPDAADGGSGAYAAASSLASDRDALPSDMLRAALLKSNPHAIAVRRSEFLAWWSEELRHEDPLVIGAVRSRIFGPRLKARLARLVEEVRGQLMESIPGMALGDGSVDESARELSRRFGAPGDLLGLGAATDRARGRDSRRTVSVLGSLRPVNEAIGRRLGDHVGNGLRVLPTEASVERWGAFGLTIDEVAVGFRRSGLMSLDPDRGICVIEGADPSEAEVRRA